MFYLHSVDDGRCIGKAEFLLRDFLSRDTTHETSYEVDVVSPDYQQQKIGTLHRELVGCNSMANSTVHFSHSELLADKLGKGSPRPGRSCLG